MESLYTLPHSADTDAGVQTKLALVWDPFSEIADLDLDPVKVLLNFEVIMEGAGHAAPLSSCTRNNVAVPIWFFRGRCN